AQKLFGYFDGPGIQGFAAGLEKMQIPQPLVNAYLAGGAEFFGGALLVLGLFTRLASIPLLVTMLVAVFVAHREAFSLKNGGMEYALTLACVVAGIGLLGPGCLSFDALFGKKKSVD
ncbi:MAG: DoxX family protein, partial [Planctomycetaceae bacterium]